MTIWPFRKRKAQEPPERRDISYEDIMGMMAPATGSGEVVNPDTAMKVSAALACVRVLAESVASLSWLLYRRLEAGGKSRAVEHPLYSLLHDRPNPLMSAFNYRERLMRDVLLYGNHFALIDWRDGYAAALWPLDPRSVSIRVTADARDLRYHIADPNRVEMKYHPQNVFHVACLGDGIAGKSVISYNAEAFGLALAEERYAGSFFGNGAFPGGVLESDKSIGDDARKRLRTGWQQAYGRGSGDTGAHRVAVLEDGLKWKPMTVSPKDAMALESRKYQVADIARMFRVPLHMIGDLDRATFSNIEHQSLEFVMHTLRPWLVRIEQEANYKLLTRDQRRELYSEFLIDSMLRGDIKSRNEAYSIMRQNGVLNADEWRERENLNPLPDGQGKKYIVQLNMQELGQVGEEVTE